jgi:hypothetical protein
MNIGCPLARIHIDSGRHMLTACGHHLGVNAPALLMR